MAFKKEARLNWRLQGDWNWHDALYGGMILASLASLIFVFTHK